MTLFVNTVTPFLRILLPTGAYAQFAAGKLEMAEDDPDYPTVLGEATRNPSISIIVSSTTCRFCGEDFSGDKAAELATAHKKAIHFDLWVKETELEAATVIAREVKSRAGFACDVCAPVQTFGSADELAAHVHLLHAAPPQLDEGGNVTGSDATGDDDGRKPGEVDPPAAAKPSNRHAPVSKTATRRAAAAG